VKQPDDDRRCGSQPVGAAGPNAVRSSSATSASTTPASSNRPSSVETSYSPSTAIRSETVHSRFSDVCHSTVVCSQSPTRLAWNPSRRSALSGNPTGRRSSYSCELRFLAREPAIEDQQCSHVVGEFGADPPGMSLSVAHSSFSTDGLPHAITLPTDVPSDSWRDLVRCMQAAACMQGSTCI
jgi:hypothetical protein